MEHPRSKTSVLAIVSLVLGILGLFCCGLFTGAAAVVCGHVAHGKIRNSQGALKGSGMAIAGFVLGYLSFFSTFILAALMIPAITGGLQMGRATQVLSNAKQVQLATSVMALDRTTTEDKSLGWPADVGVKTVAEFKALLVEKEYLGGEDVEALKIDDFQIGNVSETDPDNTIFLRAIMPSGSRSIPIIMLKSGEGRIIRSNSEPFGIDPPRDPAYLSP